MVIYVMIRLAASSKRFPSSLYVHDVDIGQVRDPTRLGGYADIFEAGHRGRPVALKRLRALTTLTSDLHKASYAKPSRDSHPLTLVSESLQGGSRLASTQTSLHPPVHRYRRRHLCFGWFHLPHFAVDASWHIEAIHGHAGIRAWARYAPIGATKSYSRRRALTSLHSLSRWPRGWSTFTRKRSSTETSKM
jgi:hypothetical protein